MFEIGVNGPCDEEGERETHQTDAELRVRTESLSFNGLFLLLLSSAPLLSVLLLV